MSIFRKKKLSKEKKQNYAEVCKNAQTVMDVWKDLKDNNSMLFIKQIEETEDYLKGIK